MISPIEHYIKVKNKVCYLYEGHSIEYALQLKSLRKSFEEIYPEIQVTIVIRDQYAEWMEGDTNWTTTSDYELNKWKWCYTIPIIYNANKELHPILREIQQSDLKMPIIDVHGPGTEYGVICPEGEFPIKSLSEENIEYLKRWVRNKGFKPIIVGNGLSIKEKKSYAENSGCVVGVECDVFWHAVLSGTPTALVPTGKGKELYNLTCRKPAIINL